MIDIDKAKYVIFLYFFFMLNDAINMAMVIMMGNIAKRNNTITNPRKAIIPIISNIKIDMETINAMQFTSSS